MPASHPKSQSFAPATSEGWGVRTIFYLAIALALCLLPIRASVIGYGLYSLQNPLRELPGATISGVYDILFVAVTALPFLVAAGFLRRRVWAQRVTVGIYAVFATMVLLAGLANVPVVAMLGGPFNYRWLYYADFLTSPDAHDAMLSQLPPRAYLTAAWFCLAMFSIGYALSWAAHWSRRIIAPRTSLAVLFGGAFVYAIFAHWFLVTQRWDPNKLHNPIYAFAASLLEASESPALFTMPVQYDPATFKPAALRADASRLPTGRAGDAKIHNVLLFVLESVPAEYLEVYGGKYPGVTPTLSKYRDRSMIVRDVYAHAPGTNVSLVSILCSTYPWISYLTLTQEHPALAVDSLSSTLKSHGYRTGFFASGDLQYQGAGRFLSHRDFDKVEEFRDRTTGEADPHFSSKQWSYLNGNDDITTANSLVRWMSEGELGSDGRPFFAMMWTLATHYPYYHKGPPTDFAPQDELLNRYLNALRDGDAALGVILKSLEDSGLLDSTLVVVVGDHGQAFGRHNQWGHGSNIYEENLRVPMVLINPQLFKGEELRAVAGLVDVAPTVLDLLNHELPGTFQGRSVFAKDRRNEVYFVAPWSDSLFGCRIGNMKLIFNSTRNMFEVYDLAADPMEERNIAAAQKEFILKAQDQLAAWVQYQAGFYREAFAGRLHRSQSVSPQSARND